jgi:cell division protein FtsB
VTRPPVPGARPGWLVLAILGVVVAAALLGDRGALHLWRLRTEVEAIHGEVRALEAENEQLARVIADLHDDPATIERIAREELGLVRPGERVLRFPRSPRPAPGRVPPAPGPARTP